jgi:hypothetical protein
MNCKPGDLAVIVRTHNKPKLLGFFVRVLRAYDGPYEWREPAWWIECNGEAVHGPDSYLQPIRGPKVPEKTRQLETA